MSLATRMRFAIGGTIFRPVHPAAHFWFLEFLWYPQVLNEVFGNICRYFQVKGYRIECKSHYYDKYDFMTCQRVSCADVIKWIIMMIVMSWVSHVTSSHAKHVTSPGDMMISYHQKCDIKCDNIISPGLMMCDIIIWHHNDVTSFLFEVTCYSSCDDLRPFRCGFLFLKHLHFFNEKKSFFITGS